MANEGVLAEFMAITSATNKARCVEFLSTLGYSLENAIESFFELPESDKELFFVADPEDEGQNNNNPGDAGGGGMVEVPVERPKLVLVNINLFSSEWKVRSGKELEVQPLWWRFYVSLNDSNFATRTVKGCREVDVNERFVTTLKMNDVGILLVELKNLMDMPLAMGGIEVTSNGAGAFEDVEGAELRMSGEELEGTVRMRITFQREQSAPKKLKRALSAGNIAGERLRIAGPSLMSLEEAKRQGLSLDKPLRRVDPLTTECGVCNKESAFDSMVVLSSCSHRFCRSCIRDSALRSFVTKNNCVCKECGLELQEKDLAKVLSRKEMDKYHEAQLERFLEADNRFIRCPNEQCKCPIETMLALSRDLEEKANGEDGQPLHGEQLRHYNEFRYRCPNCATNFCSSCMTVPYHAGYTCEEFSTFTKARHCKFCKGVIPANTKTDVCTDDECKVKSEQVCGKKLKCGHACGGSKGEPKCPPCLHEDCDSNDMQNHGSDFCSICWVEDLSSAPVLLLECGHMFHRQCIVQKIEGRWPGLRITFGYLECPLCKVRLRHQLLDPLLKSHLQLYEKIRANALNRLKVDGMEKDAKLVDPNSAYCKDPEKYAMHSFAYYICFKCKKAYFGGRRDCEQNMLENRDPSEQICFDCGDVPKVECKEPKNHAEFHAWKCRFCCKQSVWFCWGNTHFCEPCHNKAYELRDTPVNKLGKCAGKESCPLKTDHPPHGTEFSLGCGICNNANAVNASRATIGDLNDKEKDEDKHDDEEEEEGVIGFVKKTVKNVVYSKKK